jgi:hypothetical protein
MIYLPHLFKVGSRSWSTLELWRKGTGVDVGLKIGYEPEAGLNLYSGEICHQRLASSQAKTKKKRPANGLKRQVILN